MGTTVKKLKLDVIKPHTPGIIDLTTMLLALPGVEGVRTKLFETEKSTETIKLDLEGKLDYQSIKKLIEDNGGVIHSLNTVVAGKFLEE